MYEDCINCGTLIEDLLGLDPDALGAMSPAVVSGNDVALLGLGALLRRSIELALLLRDREDLVLRFKSPETARLWGFADQASANLAMLLVWTNIRGYRYCRGYRYAPILDVEEKTADVSPEADPRLNKMTNEELLQELHKAIDDVRPVDERTPDDVLGVSISEAVCSMLRVEPVQLAAGFYDTTDEAQTAFDHEPQALAGLGLATLWREVTHHYAIMRHRQVTQIELRTETDAIEAELTTARIANIITLMAASMNADNKRLIVFLPPRERSHEERSTMRAVARSVYRHYSFEARMKDWIDLSRQTAILELRVGSESPTAFCIRSAAKSTLTYCACRPCPGH